MATVHVGSVWNLHDCMRSSVPIKYFPGIFILVTQVQVSVVTSIISLWGNMKILSASHKLTETTQFFEDHEHSPLLWWSECSWWSGSREGHLRSHEVIIRFSPITRVRMEIDTRKWFQTTWLVKLLRNICTLTYLGHDLTLTWLDLRSDFQIGLLRSKGACS